MKKLLNIILLFVIVLNSFGQSKIKKDIVEAEEQLIVRDTTIIDLIEEHTSGTSVGAINGLTKTGNNIGLKGTLSESTEIEGAGNPLTIGTTGSKVTTFSVNASTGINFASDAAVTFIANGVIWACDGTYWFSSAGDTLTDFADVRALIVEAERVLPFNFEYNFSSSITDARPGVGLFKLNNAVLSNVTEIYIDYFDANSVSKNNWLSVADTGSYITVQTDDNNYAIYELTGLLVDNGNYFAYNVTYSSHSGVISGLNTIDLELNNTTGSGGGGTATSEHAYFDTISSHNTSIVYFDSPVVVEESITGDTLKSNLISNYGLTFNDIFIESEDIIRLEAKGSIVEIKSGNYRYRYEDDTLFADGTGGSTENVIKAAGYAVGDGEVVDTTYSSADVMEETLVDKLQFNPTTQAYSDGTLFYDSTERALAFFNEYANFKEELNRGVNVPFYNNTGSTIPNGKIVRSVGPKVNGSIMFSADLAGNGSIDSLQGIALTTIETLDGNYGMASLVGPVSMNTSAWSDNDLLFVGHAGELTNVNPTAPSLSDIVGRVQYADADSGVVYFFPVGEAKYRPAPVLSAKFSRESEGIANGGIDVFSVITNATNDLFTETINTGFTFQGDSLSPNQDGIYTLSFSYSFQGDAAQNDDWRIGIFKDGVEIYSTLRTSSLTNKGGVPFEATNSASAGDWFSFRISNTTSATRTSTFTDGVISVTFND